MLEAYKNIDGLADAWRLVAPDLPEARLVIVGQGRAARGRRGARRRSARTRSSGSSRSRPPRWRRRWTRRRCSCSRRARRDSVASSSRCSPAAAGSSRAVSGASRTSRATARRRCSSSRATSTSSPPRCARVLSDRELAERLGEAAHRRYRSWHTTPGRVRRPRPLARRRLAARRWHGGRAAARAPRHLGPRGRTRGAGAAGGDRPARARPGAASSARPFRVLRAVRRLRPRRDRGRVAVPRLRRAHGARLRPARPARR